MSTEQNPDPVTRSDPGPPEMPRPPRSAFTARHMAAALGALTLLVLVLAGVTRSCSFAPGGPTVDPSGLPVVDAPAALRAVRAPFPLRIPAVPAAWRSNSVALDRTSGDGRLVRVGYLTEQGNYLRLLQSEADDETLLRVETGTNPVTARGPVDVAGQRWVVFWRERGEPVWLADVPTPGGPTVRMLITGSGTEDEFRTLAAAAPAGELLAPRG